MSRVLERSSRSSKSSTGVMSEAPVTDPKLGRPGCELEGVIPPPPPPKERESSFGLLICRRGATAGLLAGDLLIGLRGSPVEFEVAEELRSGEALLGEEKEERMLGSNFSAVTSIENMSVNSRILRISSLRASVTLSTISSKIQSLKNRFIKN